MATFRILAIAIVLAGAAALAPAQACDSNYPWLCKPVPSIDPPETAESSTPAAKPQPAAKPLPITARDARTSVKMRSRVAHRAGRKAGARHWAMRARQAKIAAVRAKPTAQEPASRPLPVAAKPADMPSDRNSQPTTGFATMGSDRSAGELMVMDVPAAGVLDNPIASEPVTPAPAADASPPVATAASSPVHPAPAAAAAMKVADAAATDAAVQSSWLRGLFLAFGGLIAVGSALRLFV